MKIQISRLFVLVTMALFVFTACQKESSEVLSTENESIALKTAEDLTTSDNLFEDISNQADEQIEEAFMSGKTGEDECVVRTWAAERGTYPNTLTIDYGEGCEGLNGRVRSGKIIIHLSAEPTESGAIKTVTLENFFINEVQIEGTKTTTNNGLNELGQPSFSRTAMGTVTFLDGISIEWNVSRTAVQLEGYDTFRRFDDVFSITGTANGTNRNGVSYVGVIVKPILKKALCPWAVSGSVEFTINEETRTLDFGAGDCDRLATVTNSEGELKEILLPR
ncbi:MAG: hypothetical protein R3E32_24725 [Chitinophagales bacterium]